ncbi:hypothetical protein FOL47_011148, partial [Perkinsus chesapeaki]
VEIIIMIGEIRSESPKAKAASGSKAQKIGMPLITLQNLAAQSRKKVISPSKEEDTLANQLDKNDDEKSKIPTKIQELLEEWRTTTNYADTQADIGEEKSRLIHDGCITSLRSMDDKVQTELDLNYSCITNTASIVKRTRQATPDTINDILQPIPLTSPQVPLPAAVTNGISDVEITVKNHPFATSRRRRQQVAMKVATTRPFVAGIGQKMAKCRRSRNGQFSVVIDAPLDATLRSVSRRLVDDLLARRRHHFAADDSTSEPSAKTASKLVVQDYLRELRTLLRSIGHVSSLTASAIEMIIKGLLVNFDWLITDKDHLIEQLQARVQEDNELAGAIEALKAAHTRKIALIEKEKLRLENTIRLLEEEKATLEQSSDELKLELAQLAPTAQEVDKVRALMTEFSQLMSDFGNEGDRHGRILEDFKTFAHKMSNDTVSNNEAAARYGEDEDEGDDLRRYKKGRIVQLTTGELLLRHYDSCTVTSVGQISEGEIVQLDPKATAWICPQALRSLHDRYLWKRINPVDVDELPDILMEMLEWKMRLTPGTFNKLRPFMDSLIDFTLLRSPPHTARLEEAELWLYKVFWSTVDYPFVVRAEDMMSTPLTIQLLRRLLRACPAFLKYMDYLVKWLTDTTKDTSVLRWAEEKEDIEMTELYALLTDTFMPIDCTLIDNKKQHGMADADTSITQMTGAAVLRTLAPFCMNKEDNKKTKETKTGLEDGRWRMAEAMIHQRLRVQSAAIVAFMRRCEQISISEGVSDLIPAEDLVTALNQSNLVIGTNTEACDLLAKRIGHSDDQGEREFPCISCQKILDVFGPLGVVKHDPPLISGQSSHEKLFIIFICIADVMVTM